MGTITRRAMVRHQTATGFLHRKQVRKVRKGVPNGRVLKMSVVFGDHQPLKIERHVTRARGWA